MAEHSGAQQSAQDWPPINSVGYDATVIHQLLMEAQNDWEEH